jgi:hypothetical protein
LAGALIGSRGLVSLPKRFLEKSQSIATKDKFEFLGLFLSDSRELNRQAAEVEAGDPARKAKLMLGDHNDLVVAASSLKSKAGILVIGDREILDLDEKSQGLRIASPR